jgi:hypothetical protein
VYKKQFKIEIIEILKLIKHQHTRRHILNQRTRQGSYRSIKNSFSLRDTENSCLENSSLNQRKGLSIPKCLEALHAKADIKSIILLAILPIQLSKKKGKCVHGTLTKEAETVCPINAVECR